MAISIRYARRRASQDGLFSYVSLEQRAPQDHPLRAILRLTDRVLASLGANFDRLYASTGRPSIAPESMLRTLLLQVFLSIRSERLLVEQIGYNLLLRLTIRRISSQRRARSASPRTL